MLALSPYTSFFNQNLFKLNRSHKSYRLKGETLKTLYTSIIEPHFRYCCSVWGCCGKTEIDKLQKLQNRAARIVANSSYDVRRRPLIQSLSWETIDNLIKQEVKTITFKSVNNLAPQCDRFFHKKFPFFIS